MDFAEVVRARRMTRRFAPEPQVPTQVVAELLDLAARAPSAGHSQGWDYLVLREYADRRLFWDAATPDPPPRQGDAWLAGVSAAPTLIGCVSHESAYRDRYAERDKLALPPQLQSWPIPYWHTDTAMGAMLILLGATDRGLGSLFFGVPGERHERVKARFGIPPDRSLVGVIALGTEASRVRSPSLRRGRRTGADIGHWGRFGVPAS